jgi:hypothetical protein
MNQNIGKLPVRIYRINGDEVTVECLDGNGPQVLGNAPYRLGVAPLCDTWRQIHDPSAGTTNALIIFRAKVRASLDEFAEGRLLNLSFQIEERIK